MLVSGDGNNKHGDASIIAAVTSALEQGYFLEVWAWEKGLSTRYQILKHERPHQVSIFYLDGYFVQNGPVRDRVMNGSSGFQEKSQRFLFRLMHNAARKPC